MDSPHSSVVANENVLEQALRIYEESERSLKSICHSVEQENNQLENQLKNLQIHQTRLIKQYDLVKERVNHIQDEHKKLTQTQLIIDQQTKQISQRYEQVQRALTKILHSAVLTNENLSPETFSILGFKLVPINEEKSVTIKRKLNEQNTDFYQKHHKNSSYSQRSSK